MNPAQFGSLQLVSIKEPSHEAISYVFMKTARCRELTNHHPNSRSTSQSIVRDPICMRYCTHTPTLWLRFPLCERSPPFHCFPRSHGPVQASLSLHMICREVTGLERRSLASSRKVQQSSC